MKEIIYFVIFLVIFVVRPTGLFGLGRGSEQARPRCCFPT